MSWSPPPARQRQTTSLNDRSSFDIYVNGMFATVEKAIRLLGDGACVVLLTASPKETVSRNDSAGNSAILSFWRTCVKELKDRGIRLNAVNPGPTRTGQLRDLRTSGERSSRMLTSDRSRSLSPVEEVAEAVVFLASDDSRGITGKELFVGAGFSEL